MKVLKAFKNKKVRKSLEDYFTRHHSIYTQKVSSTQWEELSYKAFKDNKYSPDWDAGSHKKGTDIDMDGEGLSYKTGVEKYRKKDDHRYYSFSGSRLTSYETLTEKVQALENSVEDVIVFLGCDIKIADEKTEYEYTISLLDKKRIPYKKLKWDESNKNCIKGMDKNSKFKCDIRKKMSSQIWYELPYEWLTIAHKFNICSQNT